MIPEKKSMQRKSRCLRQNLDKEGKPGNGRIYRVIKEIQESDLEPEGSKRGRRKATKVWIHGPSV